MAQAPASEFKLRRPCKHCPFRTDVPGYLRRARAIQIAEDIASGATFTCHETTVEDPSDDAENVPGPNAQFCAGALIAMENEENPNQYVRIAERVGAYDASKMDSDAPVVRSLHAFVEHHSTEEELEREPCSVVGGRCLAPAGMLVGGSVMPVEPEGEVHECPKCGESVCENCSDDEGTCLSCVESGY